MAGTDSRVQRWVYETCDECGGEDVLVYDTGTSVLCAQHYRAYRARNPLKQACDRCGSTGNVWRDPIHRRNEYLCVSCHAEAGDVFQNRWAPWASKPLGVRERVTCEVADGRCRGQIRWRSSTKASLCDRHAGKSV